MRQLGIEHGDHMTPRSETPRLLVNAPLPSDLTHQKGRNKVANLTQDFEFVSALEWFRLFFHLLLVAQLQTHSNALFSNLWDAPDLQFEIVPHIPQGCQK